MGPAGLVGSAPTSPARSEVLALAADDVAWVVDRQRLDSGAAGDPREERAKRLPRHCGGAISLKSEPAAYA